MSTVEWIHVTWRIDHWYRVLIIWMKVSSDVMMLDGAGFDHIPFVLFWQDLLLLIVWELVLGVGHQLVHYQAVLVVLVVVVVGEHVLMRRIEVMQLNIWILSRMGWPVLLTCLLRAAIHLLILLTHRVALRLYQMLSVSRVEPSWLRCDHRWVVVLIWCPLVVCLVDIT